MKALYNKFTPKRAGCYNCPIQCMEHYQVKEIDSGVFSCATYQDSTVQFGCEDTDASLEFAVRYQRYGMDSSSTS